MFWKGDFMNNYNYYSSYGNSNTSTYTMSKVFGWLFYAILLTAVTSVGLPFLLAAINAVELYSTITFVGLIVVFILSFASTIVIARTQSKAVAITMFSLFAVAMGTWISPLIISYDLGTVVYALFVTAGVFGIMALYGALTKRDLSGFGSLLMMVLIGALILSLLNIFFASTPLDWVLSYVILGVYIGFVAFDVQRIKRLSQAGQLNINTSLIMALNLYIDFVYIFIRLLAILGRNRD